MSKEDAGRGGHVAACVRRLLLAISPRFHLRKDKFYTISIDRHRFLEIFIVYFLFEF